MIFNFTVRKLKYILLVLLLPLNMKSMVVNVNISAINSHRNYLISSKDYDHALKSISSGLRIVSPGDDPAGLAISEKMRGIIRSGKRKALNEQDWQSYKRTQESALDEINQVLLRIRELAVQASSGIYTTSDREIIQTEVIQLLKQINFCAKSYQFNKLPVVPDMTTDKLGISNLNLVLNPGEVINKTDYAQKIVLSRRTEYGVEDKKSEHRIKYLLKEVENLQAAESRIRDADISNQILFLNINYIKIKSGLQMFLYFTYLPSKVIRVLLGQ